MNRFALIALYRSLTRHKLYSALNIGGLAVGIAVFLVLGLYVRFETSFETWLPHHDQIYQVTSSLHLPDSTFNGDYPGTMAGLLEELQQDFPGVTGVRLRGGKNGGTVLRDGGAVAEDVAQVDPTFFTLFDLPMVQGDGRRALADPTSVLISRSTARKYFGTSDPIGQTLTVAMETPVAYRVAGVFEDIPANSDLKFSILTPLPKTKPWPLEWMWYRWGTAPLTTWLRFPTLAEARAFERKLPAFIDRRAVKDISPHASRFISLRLAPITHMHLQPTGPESAGTRLTIIALGVVGVLTLLIAVVNYVSLATARTGLRAREVAMRKVVGADRATLIRQFLGEAMLTVAISALLGLILAELGLPLVNAAGGLSLAIPYALVVPALAALVAVVGVAAGFYPALLLSRFQPAAVLASARGPGGGRAGSRLREGLAVLQFGLAIAFIIGTMVLVAQTQHNRKTDLGFRREGLMVVPSLAEPRIYPALARSLLDAFGRMPGVISVGVAGTAVGGDGDTGAEAVDPPRRVGVAPTFGVTMRSIQVGHDFFRTYSPRLLAGRLFDDAHGADDSDFEWWKGGRGRNVVINRLAVKALGFRSPADAVGKTFGGGFPRTIIGVVDQLRFFTPRAPDPPTYYQYMRNLPQSPIATIRFSGDPRAILEEARKAWRQLAPEVPFRADTADHKLEEFYKADDHAARLFAIGAVLAVAIACVGLWGLASFNTARRVKEIGIRKTLGASSKDIVLLLVGQFLRPVLIANLIAWPAAYFAARQWLAGFADRIALSPFYFLGASLIAVAIAVATVVGHALRASRAAPAWALRHE
jgi:putative ABC transport system permease protein